MRDIKFRAWYDKTKKMIDLEKITPLALNIDNPNGVFVPFDMPVMQFTGLKDKDKNEICEGDILKDLFTHLLLVVKFGHCRKLAFNGWYAYAPSIDHYTSINNDDGEEYNYQISIIGNIYENPELFESEKPETKK